MRSERTFTGWEIGILALLLIILLIALFAYVLRLYSLGFAESPSDFAKFGDYVGGTIGTIVGLTGVVFLYRTYRLQIDISTNHPLSNHRMQ